MTSDINFFNGHHHLSLLEVAYRCRKPIIYDTSKAHVFMIFSGTLPPARPCATNCPYIPWAWATAALLPWELLNLNRSVPKKIFVEGAQPCWKGATFNTRSLRTETFGYTQLTISSHLRSCFQNPSLAIGLSFLNSGEVHPLQLLKTPLWGPQRSQRSEAPICCALRNWSTRACHDRNQVAVESW